MKDKKETEAERKARLHAVKQRMLDPFMVSDSKRARKTREQQETARKKASLNKGPKGHENN